MANVVTGKGGGGTSTCNHLSVKGPSVMEAIRKMTYGVKGAVNAALGEK